MECDVAVSALTWTFFNLSKFRASRSSAAEASFRDLCVFSMRKQPRTLFKRSFTQRSTFADRVDTTRPAEWQAYLDSSPQQMRTHLCSKTSDSNEVLGELAVLTRQPSCSSDRYSGSFAVRIPRSWASSARTSTRLIC